MNSKIDNKISGVEVIKEFLKIAPTQAGIYRMIDQNEKVLYIGKAKNLAKRIINYTQLDRLSNRIKTMVSYVTQVEVITTDTEAEALLLEASLIRSTQPRYNILLRDDKSFPYILINEEHQYYRLTKHRGKKNFKGKYFGPFASVKSVNETISLLQKIFKLRSCSDSYFVSRKKPCMLYQIKRCSAPCVGKITIDAYQELVTETKDFLSGKTIKLQENLSKLMQDASELEEYELAATYRDRIKALSNIQAKQTFSNVNIDDADVIAAYEESGDYCIQAFFFRGGKNYGNKPFFPIHTEDSDPKEVISAFIGQFYQTKYPPKEIIINHEIYNKSAIEQALASIVDHRVKIVNPKAGGKLQLIKFAENNAKEALKTRANSLVKQQQLLSLVKDLFSLADIPHKIEVYDNSHIMGKHAIGAMIVATKSGFDKNSYRRFNMDKITHSFIKGGDDYAMLKEMLKRRFMRLKKECPTYQAGVWPDFLLIDGGVGHLSTVEAILKELDINVKYACIAKGPDRNAGREYFYQPNKEAFTLSSSEPVMRYLQILRDEAHRFAIGSHRIKRSNAFKASILDDIPNIGPKRKKLLLNHFGSAQAIAEARIDELMKVASINKNLATNIHNYLHTVK